MALVERESAVPLWLRDTSASDSEVIRMHSSTVEQTRYLWITFLFPSFSRAAYLFEVATQKRDATLVAISLEMYRRKHGSYPPTLDALVPQYLPAVPPDRYDGRPIKYKIVDGRPLLYSVGANRVDDGGVLPKGATRERANGLAREWIAPSQLSISAVEKEKIRGDWILWPPVQDRDATLLP